MPISPGYNAKITLKNILKIFFYAIFDNGALVG